MLRVLTLFFLALSFGISVSAQSNAVDLLKANLYAIELKDGKLSGKGFDFLMREASDAQFIAMGEQHNNREIPEFTTALFSSLHQKLGFNYLALEQDTVTLRLMSGRDFVGKRQRLLDYASERPNAFTFATDQELAMIADAGEISSAKHRRVWGLDQVFGAVHGLEILYEKIPDPTRKNKVSQMLDELKKLEAERTAKRERYTIASASEVDGFLDLLNELDDLKDPEARFVIEQMLISARVYGNNRKAGQGELTGLKSNVEREENMKRLFVDEYRQAQAAGDLLPKVLLKFGHYHIIRGRGWSNIHTLGNFVSEFAIANRKKALLIALYVNNESGDYSVMSSYPNYKVFADAAPADQWSVIDLRPLRKYAHAGKLEGGNPDFNRIVFGFDAALVIGGGTRGTYDLFTKQ